MSTLLWLWWTDTFMFLPCFSPCLLHFTLFQICFTSFHFVSLPFKIVSRHFTSFHFISNLFDFISLYFKFVSLIHFKFASLQDFISLSLHFPSSHLFLLSFTSFHVPGDSSSEYLLGVSSFQKFQWFPASCSKSQRPASSKGAEKFNSTTFLDLRKFDGFCGSFAPLCGSFAGNFQRFC